MNQLKEVVNAVLEQQKLQLAPSTYDARKNYLNHLVEYGDHLGIPVPCQELYDAYVSRAATPDLRFQLLHAVRLVDKEAGTKALTPEGKLYNEPKLPSSSESEKIFQNISFPVSDRRIDTGHLIRRAESEIIYLHLSASTRWQYMQAWRELYTFLYLSGSTVFTRESCNAFVEDTTQKHQDASLHEWKRKTRRRSICVLLEVADTGCFQWKLFLSKKTRCSDDTLEELRQQYLTFLRTRNYEKKTIALYDYAFRSFIEGTGVSDVNGLGELQPSQVQSMLVFLSERLCLNSRGTVFPIIRQILSYLYAAGFIPTDFSGMILTPAYKNTHLSKDMLDLLCRYNRIITDTYPDRTAFFPNPFGDYYSKSTLDVWFHEFWDPLPEAAMTKGNPPRVHDFRHSYCVYRLNKWVSEHADLNALYPYLSEFMGHSNFADTDYYLTLSEPFYPEFESRMRPVNASILPEVPYED